jgi:hypothetical protein
LNRIAEKQEIILTTTNSKLNGNITNEVNSDYEHYIKTFIYKIPQKKVASNFTMQPMKRFPAKDKNVSTSFAGYSRKGPKYLNLSRLMIKVFPKEPLTNNFFSSFSHSVVHDSSFFKRQRSPHF